jgi:hypothetical protein
MTFIDCASFLEERTLGKRRKKKMAEKMEVQTPEGEKKNNPLIPPAFEFPLLIPKKPNFVSQFVFIPQTRPEQVINILAPKGLNNLKDEKLRHEAEAMLPLWPLPEGEQLITMYTCDVRNGMWDQKNVKVLRGITLEMPVFFKMLNSEDFSIRNLKAWAQELCQRYNEAYSNQTSLGNRDPDYFSLRLCLGRKTNAQGNVTLLTFNMTTYSFVQKHKHEEIAMIKPSDLDVWIQFWTDGNYVNPKIRMVMGFPAEKIEHEKPVVKNYPKPIKFGFRVGFFPFCEMLGSVKFKQYIEGRKKEWLEAGNDGNLLIPFEGETPVPINREFLERTKGSWPNPTTGGTWSGVCAE